MIIRDKACAFMLWVEMHAWYFDFLEQRTHSTQELYEIFIRHYKSECTNCIENQCLLYMFAQHV